MTEINDVPTTTLWAKEKPTASSLGISVVKPKFPQYAQIARRRESFHEQDQQWPTNSPIAVEALAEAGLVYTGVGDSVRCYHCGGGLRNWEEGDNPMKEHARWYPDCHHVKLVKGQYYVKEISEHNETDEVVPDCVTYNSSSKSLVNVEVDFETTIKNNYSVQACIETGYSKEDTKKAVDIFKYRNNAHRHGNFLINCTVDDLFDILWQLEENPKLYEEYKKNMDLANECSSGDGAIDDAEAETLEKENNQMKETRQCKICLDAMADILFLPCGHMMCCGQCAPAIVRCPICRKVVNGLVKAYFATVKDKCD